MPRYRYKAIDKNNKKIVGTYMSKTPTELYTELANNGLYIIHYYELTSAQEKRFSLKPRTMSIFTNQLATMLASGMSLSKSLELLYSSEKKKELAKLYLELYEWVQMGYTLSQAMRKTSVKFSTYLIEMTRSGERSGILEQNLSRMSEYFEKEAKLKNRITGAMIYPMLLLFITIVVVIGLMTFVMPRFVSLFNGYDLPWNTKFLIFLSNAMTHYYLQIIGVIIALVGLVYLFLRDEVNRMSFDHFKLKIPKFGPLYATIITSRFARTFSSLYACGLPVLDALEITAEVIENTYVKRGIEKIAERLKRGDGLSEAIRKQNIFNPLLYSMLYVGEQSGNLPELLESTANYFDDESDAAIEKMMQLLQPILILVMAVIIGFVLFSVIIPIYKMMGSSL